MTTKQEMRDHVLQKRAAIATDDRNLWDMLIFERAHKLRPFQLAKRIHVYRSVRDEVPTAHFIDYAWGIGKDVYVPVTLEGQHELVHVRIDRQTRWKRGAFGIDEPDVDASHYIASTDARWNEECAVVVPIVGFDPACRRLGYGKGYYDRFLTSVSGTIIGVAYECQRVDNVVAEDHDIRCTCIVTEHRTYVAHD